MHSRLTRLRLRCLIPRVAMSSTLALSCPSSPVPWSHSRAQTTDSHTTEDPAVLCRVMELRSLIHAEVCWKRHRRASVIVVAPEGRLATMCGTPLARRVVRTRVGP